MFDVGFRCYHQLQPDWKVLDNLTWFINLSHFLFNVSDFSAVLSVLKFELSELRPDRSLKPGRTYYTKTTCIPRRILRVVFLF